MSQPTQTVKAVSKKSLTILFDTGVNETKLEEIGFHKDFQRETAERIVTLDLVKGVPTSRDLAGNGKWVDIRVTGQITAFGAVGTLDGDFKLMFTATPRGVYFTSVNGKKVWTFYVEAVALDVQGAIRALFNYSLLRGPKSFDSNNTMIPNFWQKALSLVFPTPQAIEISLRNKDQLFVPSRVYFYPDEPARNTLSAGGFCYHLDLDVFPRESINKGMGLWTAEDRKKNDRTGVVNIGSLIVKPGNKQKKQQRSEELASDVIAFGTSGLGVGCARTPEQLQEALVASPVEKVVRIDKNAKPAQAPASKKEKASKKG